VRSSVEIMAAYTQMRERLSTVLIEVGDDTAAATPVPTCPGWSVTDLTAHVYGVAQDVADGNVAGAGTNEWTAAQVERFAPLGVTAMVEEWNRIGPGFEDSVAAFPTEITGRIVFDSGTHEQDLRGALGMPGARDADTVLIGIEFLAGSFTGLVEREGLPGIEFVTPDLTSSAGPGPGRTRLATDTFTLNRTLTGRRSVPQILALPWEGDPTPYLSVFDGAPMQPPAVDIIE
jgi:uncharacterized protein (TIGR03083 family)